MIVSQIIIHTCVTEVETKMLMITCGWTYGRTKKVIEERASLLMLVLKLLIIEEEKESEGSVIKYLEKST